MVDILVPEGLWNSGDEAAISVWLYEDGDIVSEGAVIAEIMVEKSTFELLAPASGALRRTIDIEVPIDQGAIVGRIG